MDSGSEPASGSRGDRALGRMSDRFLALDADCRVVDWNDGGRDLLSADLTHASALHGRDVRGLLDGPDLGALRRGLDRANREDMAVTVEATLRRPEGWYEFRIYPDEEGLSLYVTRANPDPADEGVIERQASVISELYAVFNDASADLDGKIAALLSIGRDVLDTEYATLSRVHEDRYTFEYVDAADDAVEAGDEIELSWTSCEVVVASEERLVLSDIDGEAPALAAREGNRELGLSCYIGAPVTVDDEIYGTLCFYDRDAKRPQFSEWEAGLVDFMGLLVSYELQRARTEAQLRERNADLEAFRRVLSHDLRNPMTVAQGYLDVARETDDAAAIEQIGTALDRMEAIIADVSDVAAIKEGALDVEPLDTPAVAAAAWEMVDASDASLEVTGEGTLEADQSRLQRLFENLMSNAATHTDGPVTVTVGDLPDGFYVADTGDGIPAEDREQVFESGFTTGGGTGLGLSIVTEIADAHGWTYELTESESGGARFEFTGATEP